MENENENENINKEVYKEKRKKKKKKLFVKFVKSAKQNYLTTHMYVII